MYSASNWDRTTYWSWSLQVHVNICMYTHFVLFYFKRKQLFLELSKTKIPTGISKAPLRISQNTVFETGNTRNNKPWGLGLSKAPVVSSLPGGIRLPRALSCHWDLQVIQCFSSIQYSSWIDLNDYTWRKAMESTAWISLYLGGVFLWTVLMITAICKTSITCKVGL